MPGTGVGRLHRSPKAGLVESARTMLAASAGRREKVTYGQLMRRFKISRGKALSLLIGAVDRREYESGAPGFAAIVVRKDTGYPGGGYFCDDGLPRGLRRPQARSTDPRLTPAEKSHLRKQQETVWDYYEPKG